MKNFLLHIGYRQKCFGQILCRTCRNSCFWKLFTVPYCAIDTALFKRWSTSKFRLPFVVETLFQQLFKNYHVMEKLFDFCLQENRMKLMSSILERFSCLDWNSGYRMQPFKRCTDMPHAHWWTKGKCMIYPDRSRPWHAPTGKVGAWWYGIARKQFVMKYKESL